MPTTSQSRWLHWCVAECSQNLAATGGLGGDTSDGAIRAQVFDSSGAKVGGEALVNTQTLALQTEPKVTGLAGGGFVVTWTDQGGQGTDGSDVKGQIFSALGAKIGSEFVVNTERLALQANPTVAALPNGGFVVAWTDESGQGGDSSPYGVKAQIFDAAGAKVGIEFLVNTTIFGGQQAPTIASMPDGKFVVTWMDYSTSKEVIGQVFDGAGNKIGNEFVASLPQGGASIQIGDPTGPALAVLDANTFVVAWPDDSVSSTTLQDIRAQIFDFVETSVASTSVAATPSVTEIADASATTGTAYTLLLGQTAQGTLSGPGDHDWYRVNLAAGQTYSFAMVGTGIADVQDTYLRLYAADGTTLLQQNNDVGLPTRPNKNSVFTYTATTSGTHFVDAASALASDIGQYGISFTAGPHASFDLQMGGGVMDSNLSWSTPGTSAVVTYGFRQSVPTYGNLFPEKDFSTFTPLTSVQMEAVRTAIRLWSDVAGVTFQEVNPGGYTDDATILFGNYKGSPTELTSSLRKNLPRIWE